MFLKLLAKGLATTSYATFDATPNQSNAPICPAPSPPSSWLARTAPPAPPDSPSALFSDYWSWRLASSPEFATLVGDRAHNDQLETFTQVGQDTPSSPCCPQGPGL